MLVVLIHIIAAKIIKFGEAKKRFPKFYGDNYV